MFSTVTPDDSQLSAFVLWGASGHALVLAEIIALKKLRVAAFFENDANRASPFAGVPIFYKEAGFRDWASKQTDLRSIGAISAIGGARGLDRLRLLDLFAQTGLATPSLIHPRAWVSPTASLGRNCHILANATVSAHASIGDATIVNTSASVDHECVLAEGVHIGPGAVLCGCVAVERNVFVGAGATVLPRLRLGENSTIGAGAVVTRDVPPGAVVMGNPAKSR